MTDHDSDFLLDAQLRDVPLPEGLLARLRDVDGDVGSESEPRRSWSNAELDAELARVNVPLGLLVRCRKIVSDEPVDVALGDVAVPSGLLPSLREIPRRVGSREPRRAPSKLRTRLVNLALALSLAILVGGGYAGAVAGMLSSLHQTPEPQFTLLVQHQGPLGITAEPESNSAEAVALVALIEESVSGSNELTDPTAVVYVSHTESDDSPLSGPAAQWLAGVQSGLRPWQDVLHLRYGLLGAQPRTEAVAEFAAITPSIPRGIEPPAVRAFDRRFLLRQGVNPVVLPSAHEALRISRVPLSTGTGSFDLTQKRLTESRWPSPAEVRVEDFLAAVDYRFPAPAPGSVGLTMSGGPSVFGQPLQNIPSAKLLQIGVRAGDVPFRRLPATHLVIGLDASWAMQSGGRFDSARQAIRWLAGQLGMRDRLSLVVFRDSEVQLVEAVGRANVGELLFALERLEPRGTLNLGAGVQESISLALRNELDDRLTQRVALISSGGAVLPESSLSRLCELADEASSRDVGLLFLESNRVLGGDPALASLATAGRGDHRLLDSADDMRWALTEALTGDAPLVAPDAVLRITFNPRTVAGYRLLGHEPNAVSGASPARIETDLQAGQSATALFELWLLPGTEDEVAQAEVEWRDPRTGDKRIQRQSLGRLQFATQFNESSRALQQAALAAETAEVLRDSFFVQGKQHSVQHVIEASKGVSYELSKQADFRRFVVFLKDLERARVKRSD